MILSTYSSPPSPTRCNDDVDVGYCYCSPHHVLGYYYCSPQHRQAQRLNNTAVTCIIAMEENGGQRNRNDGGQPIQQHINQHEKAISILEKALRICEKEEDQEHDYAYDVCSCSDCSIDGCIVFSSEEDSSEHDDHHAENDKFVTIANEDKDNDNDGSTLYPHPLYVKEGHNMGSTVLHTLIQFNLALAYHLQCLCWMEATTNNIENEIKNNEKNESDIITINSNIHKALHFYELACDDNLSTTRSIRFDTIICNNLCHIYRYQEEKEEDEQHYHHQQQQVTQQQQQPITTVTDNEDDNDDDNEDDDDGISFGNADMADDRLEIDYYRQEEKEQIKYERNNTSPPLLPVSIERSLWSLLPDFQ